MLERGRELEAIERLVAGAAAGDGRLLVFEARPGLGKTALLDEATRRAAAAGLRVARAAGAELEGELDFGLMSRLLGRGAAAVEIHAEPQRLVLAHDQLSADGVGLVVVDDLHWVDAPSLRFLQFVLARRQIALCAAGTTLHPLARERAAELARLITDPQAEVLTLEALSRDAVATLARRRSPVADRVVDSWFEATAGNPFLVRELAAHDGTGVPVSVKGWVARRLARLGPRAADVAAAAAALGPEHATTGRVAELCECEHGDVVDAFDALATEGLVHPGDPIAFIEPLVADSVLAGLVHGRHALLRAGAARLLAAARAGDETVGASLLDAPRAGDEWVVERLADAARVAAARGDHPAAATYLSRALEEPPPDARAAGLLVDLAEAEALSGSLGAIDRLEAALRLAREPEERTATLATLGWRLYQAGHVHEARLAFTRAISEPGEATAERAEAEIAARALGALDGSWSLAEMRAFLETAGDGDSDGPAAVPVALAAVVTDSDARLARDAALRALRSLGAGSGGIDLLIASCAMSALVWSDVLDAAEPLIAAGIADAEQRADPHALAYLRFGRSWTRYWRGDVRGAADDVLFAVDAWAGDWSFNLPSAVWWASHCLVELGRAGEASALVARARRPSPWPDPLQHGYLAAGRLHAAVARADWNEAERQVVTVERLALAWFDSSAITHWQADAVLTLARAGRRERALELGAAYLAAARRFGAPRGLGIALRTLALVEGGERGLALVSEAVAVLETSQSTIELVRALVDQGALLRSLGKRRRARSALMRALESAAGMSAVALEERARMELEMLGGLRAGLGASGPAALTPSERRVVELAAIGRSNPDIAAELFVTRKTVEFHLGNAYRKLGVASREELGDALGGG